MTQGLLTLFACSVDLYGMSAALSLNSNWTSFLFCKQILYSNVQTLVSA